MAYVKNDPAWQEGTAPGISAERLNHLETQYDEAKTDLDTHKGAATIDHPNSSVTDAKIGNRTADQGQTPSGNTGLLGQFISWFANRIKTITGKTYWYDAPDITLATLAAHKSRHATGGADILAPADIGAIAVPGGSAQGDVLIRDATGWTRLAASTSGYVLSTQGAGANPQWIKPPQSSGYSANCQATNIPTNSEVRFARFTVPTGKTLKLLAAGVYPSGVTNHIVELYNNTDSLSVYSTTSSMVLGELASVDAGKEVIFRVKNTSGAERAGSLGFLSFVFE